MNKELLKKYCNNACTEEELNSVLEWFKGSTRTPVRLFQSDFQFSIPTKKHGSKFFHRIDYMWVNPKITS